jgi:dolichol-phosphate mannosyltransferase
MASTVLRFLRLVPMRFLSFALVGGVGVIIHFLVLTLLFTRWKIDYAWSHSAATLTAMAGNFVLNNMMTYRDMRLRGWQWIVGWLSFSLACTSGALVNIGIATGLVWSGTHWVAAALAGIVVGSVWNYRLTAIVTWKRNASEQRLEQETGYEI